MDYKEYRDKYFANPAPEPRFGFKGIFGATLYYQDYPGALAFFKQVFGPPAYVEGENTHGWQIGPTWLTVFPSKEGVPTNLEVMLYLENETVVDKLFAAMIAAGAKGEPPVDTLMYTPVRIATVKDPFEGIFTLVAERTEN
jgi:uncharacterized glyoxalase superfamily protein PhnB